MHSTVHWKAPKGNGPMHSTLHWKAPKGTLAWDDLVPKGAQMGGGGGGGGGFLTVNKICFKPFVLLLLCVCIHNWSVSQWKQYELQIWSSWRNINFWKWKAPRNLTPEHAHSGCFQCFHSHTWWIKTLTQSPICTEEVSLYTVHITLIINKVLILELEAPKCSRLNVVCVEMFHDQHPRTI